jgi:hypothetical protein
MEPLRNWRTHGILIFEDSSPRDGSQSTVYGIQGGIRRPGLRAKSMETTLGAASELEDPAYRLLLTCPSDYNGFESFVEENGLCPNVKRSNGHNFGWAS